MDHVADLKVAQGVDLEVAAWEDPGVALVDVEVAEEWGLVAEVVAHGVAQVAKIGKFLVGAKGVQVDVGIQTRVDDKLFLSGPVRVEYNWISLVSGP